MGKPLSERPTYVGAGMPATQAPTSDPGWFGKPSYRNTCDKALTPVPFVPATFSDRLPFQTASRDRRLVSVHAVLDESADGASGRSAKPSGIVRRISSTATLKGVMMGVRPSAKPSTGFQRSDQEAVQLRSRKSGCCGSGSSEDGEAISCWRLGLVGSVPSWTVRDVEGCVIRATSGPDAAADSSRFCAKRPGAAAPAPM